MSTYKTAKKDRVPIAQKAAFGSGHFVLNLLPGALSFFMFFLLTGFGMKPLYAGILGALPRLFDAFTDPIMGFISDNTNSRWGRRRPYILVGAIASGILFMILWQMDETNSQTYNFWYFLILSILFIIGNTIYATPLVGLGYEMTSDYNERTRLMAYANTMGQIAWMIVPWFWVIIADPNLFNNQAEGVREMSVYVALVCIVLGILPALFCKGIDSSSIKNRKEINLKTLGKNIIQLFKSIKEVAKNKPFVKLCATTFLVFNGFQMVAAFSVYIIVFYMYNGSYEAAGTWPAWFSTITALLTAFIVIPIVSRIANVVGKRKAFIIATVISIIGYLLKWWGFDIELNQKFNETALAQSLNNGLGSFFETINPFLESLGMSWFNIDTSQGVPWLILMPVPLIAFGMGSLFTLMMSMTADVCDLDELENGMPRKEGTFGAIYWWMVKIGQSIALFLGGLVLQLVGFISDAPVQTAETMHSLRIADIIIPSVTAALAIWVMWNYSLTEEKAREIKEELVARRGEL
ncbi:MFS transporter [Seonamhaeicola aphaedonensis]|uniref:GPH family glycoside/pentoside/hexuronide:cation symporter n=1 Tax=Seonamhaeicola aphaedonensis TaxID=1461338 RepID=A0A3D9HHN2_9FLAO|nr:MFS transporter [Seonamhaeicola aphaedonensis]RED48997.1 GPH family glycoside/pentoside/hexuronide:cation symporter [Seonamhaeicola aphaedonensis]